MAVQKDLGNRSMMSMKFRRLGKTNIEVGIIGLGTEYVWFDPFKKVEEVVQEAIDHGVNYMDVFMGSPGIRDHLGKILKKRRQEVLIAGHLGCMDIDGQYAKTRNVEKAEIFINDFYKRLQTDYIDVLFLHNINEDIELEEAFNSGGILDLAFKLQKAGRARFIGFSSHKVPVSLKALRSGSIDVLMFPVNPAFDVLPGTTNHEDRADEKDKDFIKDAHDIKEREILYQECQEKDIGFVAMKPYGAGRIFSLLKNNSIALNHERAVMQCIHYALTRPGVSTVVPGCKNASEVRSALKYLDATDQEKDHSILIKNLDLNLKGKCMYCNHCQPCPQGLDIAGIIKLIDSADTGSVEILNQKYIALRKKASDCRECGTCEERCPFDVTVISKIKKAVETFGS